MKAQDTTMLFTGCMRFRDWPYKDKARRVAAYAIQAYGAWWVISLLTGRGIHA